LPYVHLKRAIMLLYPIAILGLIAAQFSGFSFDGQPYLNLFGLKIKIVDLAACLMVIALPAIGTSVRGAFGKQRNFLLPLLVLAPVFYFSALGSMFSAVVLLVGGLMGLIPIGLGYVATAALGAMGVIVISIASREPFLSLERLQGAIVTDAHTDFVLGSLAKHTWMGAPLATALFVVFLLHIILSLGAIKTQWLKATVMACATIFGMEILFGVTSNYGLAPMFKAGVNLPFLSYGGSHMVVHLLMTGIVLACLKRRSVIYG